MSHGASETAAGFPLWVLRLASLLFLLFGAAFFLWPVGLPANVEIRVPTSTAATDVRAVYGGLQLGVGLFLGWCALDRSRLRVGLLAFAFAIGSMAATRVAGFVVDGSPAAINALLLAGELGGLALAAAALRWERWAAQSSRAR